MCGIFISELSQDQSLCRSRQALNSLSRRGPDSEFLYNNNNIFVGQTVLSFARNNKHSKSEHITEDGRFVILLNGEIYNWKQLARSLFGDTANIGSDVCLLKEMARLENGGLNTKLLVGMFVICVYDNHEYTLTVYTDICGEKSCFYSDDGEALLVSSEIGPIKRIAPNRFPVDTEIINEYFLTRHFTPDVLTVWKGLYRTCPGAKIIFNLKTRKLIKSTHGSLLDLFDSKYYKFQSRPDSYNDLKHDLDEKLKESCRLFFNNKVSPGAIVSGGVDSTLVGWYCNAVGRATNYVSLVFPGKDEQVIDFIRASSIDVSYEVIDQERYSGIANEAYDIAYQPLPTHSFISQILVSKLAKKLGILELYNGELGDELFGGYEAYKYIFNLDKSAYVTSPSPYSNINTRYWSDTLDYRETNVFRSLQNIWKSVKKIYKDNEIAFDPMGAISLVDTRWNGFNVGLLTGDLATSAQGMESRSFFACKPSLELAINLPGFVKVKSNCDGLLRTKPLLNDLLFGKYKYAPEAKQGFSGFPDALADGLLTDRVFVDFINHVRHQNFDKELYDADRAFRWKIINLFNFYKRCA